MDIYSGNGCTKLLPLLHSHILTDINVYCDWVIETPMKIILQITVDFVCNKTKIVIPEMLNKYTRYQRKACFFSIFFIQFGTNYHQTIIANQ